MNKTAYAFKSSNYQKKYPYNMHNPLRTNTLRITANTANQQTQRTQQTLTVYLMHAISLLNQIPLPCRMNVC